MQKLLCLIFPLLASSGQPSGKIYFRNASFEDRPGTGKAPKGWYFDTPGNTPDVLPGAWEIMEPKAYDGKTYVGLITREDGTYEDIRQSLAEPLKAGQCYTFSIYLAHAPKYVGYNKPTRLRILGASAKGGQLEILANSPLVDHPTWKQYKFEFTPSRDVTQLVFEACFAPGAVFKYRGNVLLDLCSPIEKCVRA
jgi:hypothetical protein